MSSPYYSGIYMKGNVVYWKDIKIEKKQLFKVLKEKLSCENLDYVSLNGGFYIFFDAKQREKNIQYNHTLLSLDTRAKLFRGDGILICTGEARDLTRLCGDFTEAITLETSERLGYTRKMKTIGHDHTVRQNGLLCYR